MDWKKLVTDVIPVAASMTGNANIEAAAAMMTDAVDAHLTNQAAQTGRSRDELLQEYKGRWESNIDKADKLLKKGHENES